MAPLVKRLTLDPGSGLDLTVGEFEPTSGSVLTSEPAWDSLCPSLSLSQNKYINFKIK